MNKLTEKICGLIGIAAAMLGSCTQAPTYAMPNQTRPSYVAIETNTGRVLYAGNSNERRPIGMLTNIACTLVVLDWIDARNISLDTQLVVPNTVLQNPKTNLLHLRPGDRISLRDALHAAILWDDSACAATMAHACGGTISASKPEASFVAQMNQLARAIGMTDTRFKGSHGSIISLSTARDLALLGTYAIQKPSFRAICSKQYHVATVNGTRSVSIRNSNQLISDPSVDGLKAACSTSSGNCLMASATRASVKRDNPKTGQPATYAQRLLVVVLGMRNSSDRYSATRSMLNDGWGEWENWMQTADTSDPHKFIILPK